MLDGIKFIFSASMQQRLADWGERLRGLYSYWQGQRWHISTLRLRKLLKIWLSTQACLELERDFTPMEYSQQVCGVRGAAGKIFHES